MCLILYLLWKSIYTRWVFHLMVVDLCIVMLHLFRFYFEFSKKSESSTEDLWYPKSGSVSLKSVVSVC